MRYNCSRSVGFLSLNLPSQCVTTVHALLVSCYVLAKDEHNTMVIHKVQIMIIFYLLGPPITVKFL